jgi:ABC-2 type transport system ATP-binding protein
MYSAIQTEGLSKRFGDKVVLDGLDLDIAAGGVFALLGPNGAGKTTTVHILSTLLRPDAGVARVGGHDVVREAAAVRRLIGVTGQFSAVDNILTGEENLQLMARLRHLPRADARRRVAELLERFDLTDAARKPLATYSGGMRRRLDLAMTLVDRPQIVFLDEPTTGLDPRSRAEMWQIVRELVAAGSTILLTTQHLEEADELASRIAVLDQGHLVADGTPSELKRLVPGGRIRLEFSDAEELDAAATVFGNGTRDDQALALDVPSPGDLTALRAVLDRVDNEELTARALTVHTPDLEDVFFALTGRHGAEEPTKQLAGTPAEES